MIPLDTIINGPCLEVMQGLPAKSFHMCVTSPPYWGQRDYGVAGQLGLERTPEEYVAKLVEICRGIWRTLRDDGTFWLVIGDSYASGKGTCYNPGGGDSSLGKVRKAAGVHPLDRGSITSLAASGLKPKDLVGIPWRVAFALQADGWYLRRDIIWHKPNPMPESVTDRCTTAHEYVFMLTKSSRYYYDAEAIKEAGSQTSHGGGQYHDQRYSIQSGRNDGGKEAFLSAKPAGANGRNKRSVWTIPTKPYKGAHFATYPPELIKPCIMAGTSAKGVCPDCGAPWERVVEKATAPHPNRWSKTNDAKQFDKTDNQYGEAGGLGVAHISTTIGFRPVCRCYDELYRAAMPRTSIKRKHYQQDAADRWWPRARRRPGLDGWAVSPAIVLDPFMGSGTTADVARGLGCKFVGIELNEKYCEIARNRVGQTEANLFGG